MKIAGLILVIIGGLALCIGLFVSIVTWTQDWKSVTAMCQQAVIDEPAFAEAERYCRSLKTNSYSSYSSSSSQDAYNSCYRNKTIGLTSESDCKHKEEFVKETLIIYGIVPAVTGFIMALVGLSFFMRRKTLA